MSAQYTLTLLPGDGIGPEVMAQVRKIISWLEENSAARFTLHEDDIGGAAYDRYDQPLADVTLEKCKASDAVIMGAVGGPKWDTVDYNKRPEAAFYACARKWGCLPTCARQLCSMRWLMHRH
jgi:3-isopropylmalate dehydrogenase